MTKTVVNTDIERSVIGYMLNTPLDEQNQKKILELQENLSKRFGDAIWDTPPKSLHITLFDWIAPLVEYGQDKEKLFERIFDEYDHVVSEATKNVKPITVHFVSVQAAPGAIFMVGQDNGEFEKIRAEFLDKIELLPNTKKPPTIIHATLGRFVEEIELETVQEFLSDLTFSLTQNIDHFRLIKETLDPVLEFETIKEYKLGLY